MRVKPRRAFELSVTEKEARILVAALEDRYGRWHDTHGFRWQDASAETMHATLCEQLGLDDTKLEVVQA